jgi:hypothetical protein
MGRCMSRYAEAADPAPRAEGRGSFRRKRLGAQTLTTAWETTTPAHALHTGRGLGWRVGRTILVFEHGVHTTSPHAWQLLRDCRLLNVTLHRAHRGASWCSTHFPDTDTLGVDPNGHQLDLGPGDVGEPPAGGLDGAPDPGDVEPEAPPDCGIHAMPTYQQRVGCVK